MVVIRYWVGEETESDSRLVRLAGKGCGSHESSADAAGTLAEMRDAGASCGGMKLISWLGII